MKLNKEQTQSVACLIADVMRNANEALDKYNLGEDGELNRIHWHSFRFQEYILLGIRRTIGKLGIYCSYDFDDENMPGYSGFRLGDKKYSIYKRKNSYSWEEISD